MKLEKENFHPRDSLIHFNSKRHVYSTSLCNKLSSVTNWVYKHFEPFNAKLVIDNMRKSKNWNSNNKYFGMTDSEIQDLWKNNGKISRELGTALHEKIEKWCNDENVEHDEDDDVAFNQFLEWDNAKSSDGWMPYRTEWKIFDEDLQIAGTADAVYMNDKGEYILIDWKRCKEIKFENRWQSATSDEIKHLSDCNYVKYSLQLNVYKYILEKNYGINISKMLIVNVHPDQKSFQEIEALSIQPEVKKMFGIQENVSMKSSTSVDLLRDAASPLSKTLKDRLKKGIKISAILYLE
jgi:hypothetical protein